jgi:protein-disulfide isomerase
MIQRTQLVVPVSERDHHQGPAAAAVTLVQYGDYECPYTRQSTTIVRAIQQQLEEQLRFVYRNFPLAGIEEEVAGGERSGVQGTPTFFINGVLYRGSWEQDALLAALQAASRTL